VSTPHVPATTAGPLPLPDVSVLKDLPQGVAYALLAVILVAIVLFYLGPVLRERLRPGQNPPPTPPADPPSAVAALPQAVDRGGEMADRLIRHLEEQVDTLTRERDQAREQAAQAQAEINRLMMQLWRREGP
jgi:hypothetical protein